MTAVWSQEKLERIGRAEELQIATKACRRDAAALGADLGCMRRSAGICADLVPT